MSGNGSAGWTPQPMPGSRFPPVPLGVPYRPPAPVAVVFGRIICFLGLAAAVVCSVVWIFVGTMALAAGPTCTECVGGWAPPVLMGVLGPIVPLGWWTVVLIAQWRRSMLLLWSLLGWPLLGMVNVWAIERFSGLLNQ